MLILLESYPVCQSFHLILIFRLLPFPDVAAYILRDSSVAGRLALVPSPYSRASSVAASSGTDFGILGLVFNDVLSGKYVCNSVAKVTMMVKRAVARKVFTYTPLHSLRFRFV